MKFRSTGFKVFLTFLSIMAITVSLTGCSSSKVNTSSDKGTKVKQPTNGSQEQGGKNEPASSNDVEKLLTTSDVEQVCGYKGVKTIPYNPQIGAGGKLNFAIGSNELVLAVMVEDSSMFNSWKSNKDLNAASLPDLGDEAFRGVADSDMYTPNVTFIKGDRAIQLFTFFNIKDNMKPYLDHEKLIKLAKIIEGRM